MFPTSTRDLIRFTPSDIAPGGEHPPVYLLSAPTLREKAAFRRDVAAAGVRWVSDTDLFDVLRQGIKAIVESDAQAELIERIDQFEADRAKPAEERDATLADDLREIEQAVTRHFEPYAAAMADRGEWFAVAPLVACQHFLRGWENIDVPFERRAGKVPDAVLAQLPESHLGQIGARVFELMSPSRDEQKKSE